MNLDARFGRMRRAVHSSAEAILLMRLVVVVVVVVLLFRVCVWLCVCVRSALAKRPHNNTRQQNVGRDKASVGNDD